MKNLVTEFAVDFITISSEDFPKHRNKRCFHELFPAFSFYYDIVDRIPELLFCIQFLYTLVLLMFIF